MSTAPANNKYILKSLEEEIGLFDRKIAHLQNFEVFASEEERQTAAGKLTTKRERLVRTLRDLTDPAPEVPATETTKKKKTSPRKSPVQAKTSLQASHAASASAEPVQTEHGSL